MWPINYIIICYNEITPERTGVGSSESKHYRRVTTNLNDPTTIAVVHWSILKIVVNETK